MFVLVLLLAGLEGVFDRVLPGGEELGHRLRQSDASHPRVSPADYLPEFP